MRSTNQASAPRMGAQLNDHPTDSIEAQLLAAFEAKEWIALRWGDIDRGSRTCRLHRTFTAGALSRDAKTAAASPSAHSRPRRWMRGMNYRRRCDRHSSSSREPAGAFESRELPKARVVRGSRRCGAGPTSALPDAAHIRDARARGRGSHRMGQPADGASGYPNDVAVLSALPSGGRREKPRSARRIRG